jgi:hypothetical protein
VRRVVGRALDSAPVDLPDQKPRSVNTDLLLFESAYAELWFTDRMWLDFAEFDFHTALGEFSCRIQFR